MLSVATFPTAITARKCQRERVVRQRPPVVDGGVRVLAPAVPLIVRTWLGEDAASGLDPAAREVRDVDEVGATEGVALLERRCSPLAPSFLRAGRRAFPASGECARRRGSPCHSGHCRSFRFAPVRRRRPHGETVTPRGEPRRDEPVAVVPIGVRPSVLDPGQLPVDQKLNLGDSRAWQGRTVTQRIRWGNTLLPSSVELTANAPYARHRGVPPQGRRR